MIKNKVETKIELAERMVKRAEAKYKIAQTNFENSCVLTKKLEVLTELLGSMRPNSQPANFTEQNNYEACISDPKQLRIIENKIIEIVNKL